MLIKTRSTAIAVCSFAIKPGNALQIFPASDFRGSSGRPLGLKSWKINGDIAQKIIALVAAKANDLLIDYEHQTLETENNGQEAPASGWIKRASLEWREGEGLFANDYKWTAKAKGYIDGDEYRYLSPVFSYNKKTGEIIDLLHIGLVNTADIDGMDQVAAAKFSNQPNNQEIQMDEELKKLLGLSKDATQEEVIAACKAIQDKNEANETEIVALKAKVQEGNTEVAALKATSGIVDPAKFTPNEVVEELKTQVAALKLSVDKGEVDDLVTVALKNGQLIPAQEKWARDLAKQHGVAALKSYVDSAPEIAALKGQQTDGRTFDKDGKATLTADEIAICKQLNISEDDYANSLEDEK